MPVYPFVIWAGSEPLKSRGRFRLVHRGPVREHRPDDVPFGLEQCTGVSFMKDRQWGGIKSHEHAIHAITHVLGLLLIVDPKRLNLDHPLYCELNLAVAEGREPRGCDCDKPADPMRKA
jgi:hypothetical protein